MFTWLRARKAAKRLKLRDKGSVQHHWSQDLEITVVNVHVTCRTVTRIGIDTQGIAYEYCWRCERILGTSYRPPKGKEPLPIPQDMSVAAPGSNVVPFPKKKNIA